MRYCTRRRKITSPFSGNDFGFCVSRRGSAAGTRSGPHQPGCACTRMKRSALARAASVTANTSATVSSPRRAAEIRGAWSAARRRPTGGEQLGRGVAGGFPGDADARKGGMRHVAQQLDIAGARHRNIFWNAPANDTSRFNDLERQVIPGRKCAHWRGQRSQRCASANGGRSVSASA